MFNSYFSNQQFFLLVSGSICFLLSLSFHLKEKEKATILFLILTATLVYSFAALLDPFLNIWDERFHALVAKNLMKHPFMPTLYEEQIVNTNYEGWDKTHIWLHKQPLFLWQMALSFKLFGINEFTLRIPSIILSVLLVFVAYRSGKLLVNERVGYIAAILLISSVFLIELVAGRQTTDHNDLSFIAYVSFSIWALIEYHFSKSKKWIFLIGIFSGFAILCKWLVGLLVYLGWLVIKMQEKDLTSIKNFKDIFLSFLLTLFITLPWQVFIFLKYPTEAFLEFQHSNSHFLKPIEGHSGNYWFHFDEFGALFGSLSIWLIIPAFIAFYYRIREKKIYFSILSMIVGVYIFFTLATTKMSAFTFIVVLPVFITIATFIDAFLNKIVSNRIATPMVFIFVLIIAVFRFDIASLQKIHTDRNNKNTYSKMMISNKRIFQNLNLPDNTVLFNVKGRHYIEAMFYSGLPAYRFIPSLEQFEDIENKGKITALFMPSDGVLPDYLLKDTTVIRLNAEIQGYN
jgi:4-amino-4-deoxy-L-arabinose transferase-like glycosyltransferase